MPVQLSQAQILAIWLGGAATELGTRTENTLRKVVRLATVHADEMYTPHDADPATLEEHDPLGVKAVLAEFAAALDEDVRNRKAGDS